MEIMTETEKDSFDAKSFIERVAKVSRTDDVPPDSEKAIGRECYAFSAQEDAAFAVAESAAREILAAFEEGKDYEIRRDPIGNSFITFKAAGSNLPAIWVGSHLDSVADGGKYDGVAGVAAGLEVLSVLASGTIKPRRDFTVAVFRSEESSPKNSVGCLGSTVACGLMSKDALNAIKYDNDSGVTLREHFSSKYGAERWSAVEESVGSSNISNESVGAYIELHIEQSSVTSANKRDIGIVVDGIGGARREKVGTPLKPQVIDTKKELYEKVTLTFQGEPNHTGGTPPNRNFYTVPGVVWYRKDALVASSNMTNKLLRDGSYHVLASRPPRATGFTSVPAQQIVELLIPRSKLSEFKSEFEMLADETEKKLGVTVSSSSAEFSAAEAAVVDASRVRQIFNIPQVVSSLATKAFNEQQTETGTTRATVVDYFLTPDRVAYNLDLREVNEEDLKTLLDAIHRRQEKTLGAGKTTLISAKVHSPVDPEIAGRLQEHARELGFTFVLMPSGPGHDADRMAAKRIPVGMVFVRQQDGVSHNPRESMDWDDYKKASVVMQKAVLKLLREE